MEPDHKIDFAVEQLHQEEPAAIGAVGDQDFPRLQTVQQPAGEWQIVVLP
jgi:hypothetical protein